MCNKHVAAPVIGTASPAPTGCKVKFFSVCITVKLVDVYVYVYVYVNGYVYGYVVSML